MPELNNSETVLLKDYGLTNLFSKLDTIGSMEIGRLQGLFLNEDVIGAKPMIFRIRNMLVSTVETWEKNITAIPETDLPYLVVQLNRKLGSIEEHTSTLVSQMNSDNSVDNNSGIVANIFKQDLLVDLTARLLNRFENS
ncbi:MAG: hypothetical protein WCK31_00870 [bacterium]